MNKTKKSLAAETQDYLYMQVVLIVFRAEAVCTHGAASARNIEEQYLDLLETELAHSRREKKLRVHAANLLITGVAKIGRGGRLNEVRKSI